MLWHIQNGTLGMTHALPHYVAVPDMVGHRITAAGKREDSMMPEAGLPQGEHLVLDLLWKKWLVNTVQSGRTFS